MALCCNNIVITSHNCHEYILLDYSRTCVILFIFYHRDTVPKQCCGLSSPPVRWSILGVGFVGLVCAGAGTLLGALKASGRDHLLGIFMSGKQIHFSLFIDVNKKLSN